jgi:predicted MPP superfamily phosphohydrolase
LWQRALPHSGGGPGTVRRAPQTTKLEYDRPVSIAMKESLLLREMLILLPLIAVQWAICRSLRKRHQGWPSTAMTVVAAAAAFISLASNWWLFGFRFRSPFWDAVADSGAFGFIWMLACLPAYLIYLACLRMGVWDKKSEPESVSPDRRKVLQTASALAVASPFVALTYGVLVGRLDFQVREVSLAIPGLHPDLDGLRILHLSDVHLGQFMGEREFERVVDMANGLRPNLAIMTGDLISRPGDPMEACVRQLARVRSDAGMYGCLGNHEMYSEMEAPVQAEGARHGIPFLRHENRQLRFGNAVMNIGGVDYQRAASRKNYLKGAETLLRDGALNVMLSHNPDVFPVAAKQGWDLMLAGHTHGGQVTFEIVEQNVNVARFFTPFVAGEYHLGKAGCYVTRGIGTVGLPARVGVPPEITLLRLRKA